MKAIVIGAHPPSNVGGQTADALRTRGWDVVTPDVRRLDVTQREDMLDFDWDANALVYSAGYCEPEWIYRTAPESIDHQIKVNLTGALVAVAMFARTSVSGSSIVLIGSRAAETPHRGQTPYNAAKAGLRIAVATMARELHPMGFRVFLIEPGAINGTEYGQRVADGARRIGMDDRAGVTRGTLGRNLDPDEVAELAANLVCSKFDDEYQWLAGAPIPFGGGPQ